MNERVPHYKIYHYNNGNKAIFNIAGKKLKDADIEYIASNEEETRLVTHIAFGNYFDI